MGYRWIYSITVRTLLLVGGVVLVTLGIVYGKGGLLIAGLSFMCRFHFLFSGKCSSNCVKRVG